QHAGRDVDQRVPILPAGLEQHHFRAILGEAAGHHTPGRAGPDHDVICFHHPDPLLAHHRVHYTTEVRRTRSSLRTLFGRPGESRDPLVSLVDVEKWAPAFAGTTAYFFSVISVPAWLFDGERGEQAADHRLGVGSAHDLSHDGDAARAGGEA